MEIMGSFRGRVVVGGWSGRRLGYVRWRGFEACVLTFFFLTFTFPSLDCMRASTAGALTQPPANEGVAKASTFVRKGQETVDLSALALRDLQGKPLDAARYEGRSVVLYFWSIHCSSCLSSLKKLDAMRAQLAERKADLIAVHLLEAEPEQISRVASQLEVGLPILTGSDEVRELLNVRMLPSCLALNAERAVVGKCDVDRLLGKF